MATGAAGSAAGSEELDPSALGDDNQGTKTPDPKAKPADGGAADKGGDGSASGGAKTGAKGGDGDEPSEGISKYEKEGKKFYRGSEAAFKDYIEKKTRKQLKEIFGTSDKKTLIETKKQFDEWQKEAKEREKADLSEKERISKEKDEAVARAETAERRANRAADRMMRAKVERKVSSIAREHVNADSLDDAVVLFRSHLSGLSKRKLEHLNRHPEEWGQWFKELSEKKPHYAKGSKPNGEETDTEVKDERKAANNGVGGTKEKPLPGKADGGKKVKDMTPAELREWSARTGNKIPSTMSLVDPSGVRGAVPPSQLSGRRAS
jgi:hypothetical protein